MDLLSIEGYVREVGDIGLGMRGSKPGKGVVLEVLGGEDVEIRGLTGPQCSEFAKQFRQLVRVTVSASGCEEQK